MFKKNSVQLKGICQVSGYKTWRVCLCLFFLLLCQQKALATNFSWPLWQSFQEKFISHDGRVIDPYLQRNITTSEGQSYALFFALVSNQPVLFQRILTWTENNLANGNMAKQLPAWQWGKSKTGQWQILDNNPASDSDLWIIYSLIEAARLWHKPEYLNLAGQMSKLVMATEVVELDGLGVTLLPGPHGFYQKNKKVRLNPSYLPISLLQRFADTFTDKKWKALLQSSYQLLVASSPQGFSPDWIEFDLNKGLLIQQNIGSYNAIRVYLWAGMMHPKAKYSLQLRKQFQPMLVFLTEHQYSPLQMNIETGQNVGKGDEGFTAALLPLVKQTNNQVLETKLLSMINTQQIIQQHSYYQHVLSLFGLGWYQQKFSFSQNGQLLPTWESR
jgi:endoglucanase